MNDEYFEQLGYAPFLDLRRLLNSVTSNPIQHQMMIEMLMAWHASRIDADNHSRKMSGEVIDAMAKHAKQFIKIVRDDP